jgi:hypothetical protein
MQKEFSHFLVTLSHHLNKFSSRFMPMGEKHCVVDFAAPPGDNQWDKSVDYFIIYSIG